MNNDSLTTDTSTNSSGHGRRRWIIGLSALAITAAVAVPMVASAAPATPAPTVAAVTAAANGGSGTNRLAKLCARVGTAEGKVNAALARLQADASTKGSIAWLQAQIADATAKGKTEKATLLQGRLAERQAMVQVLQLKLTEIGNVKQICTAHGVTA